MRTIGDFTSRSDGLGPHIWQFGLTAGVTPIPRDRFLADSFGGEHEAVGKTDSGSYLPISDLPFHFVPGNHDDAGNSGRIEYVRSTAANSDLGAYIRRVYRLVDEGFDIPAEEERAIRATRGSPVYGEITAGAVSRMIDYLDLESKDVFYDLGSGTGKVVNHVAISRPVRRCVGIELSPSRTTAARSVLLRLRADNRVRAHRCVFRCENLLESSLSDATVVYTCSTAFSDRFLASLFRRIRTQPRVRLLLSVKPLSSAPGFELIDTLRLDMSWQRRDRVHVYRPINRP